MLRNCLSFSIIFTRNLAVLPTPVFVLLTWTKIFKAIWWQIHFACTCYIVETRFPKASAKLSLIKNQRIAKRKTNQHFHRSIDIPEYCDPHIHAVFFSFLVRCASSQKVSRKEQAEVVSRGRGEVLLLLLHCSFTVLDLNAVLISISELSKIALSVQI